MKLPYLFIIIVCSVNHIPEDHERHNSFESLPQGVENMSNYVEISSWYGLNKVSLNPEPAVYYEDVLFFLVWITLPLKTFTCKQLP